METSRAAAPPLEDSNAAGILIYRMVSADLVTRGIRPPYIPVTILATDDKPDNTVPHDCGLDHSRSGAPCSRCCALQRLSRSHGQQEELS
jgi:hypothetical protein